MIELIDIPAGTLIMGDSRLLDAAPQHAIRLHAFRIAKFPITNEQYADFVRAGGYRTREYWTEMGWKALAARPYSAPAYWNDPRFNQPRQPVVGVTWYEAIAFCRWRTATGSAGGNMACRLPTEAEWEYAARGPDSGRSYPWGDRFEIGRANTAELRLGKTTSVDYYPDGVSPFGVWDMSGNVFEWTLSRWGMNWQDLQYVYPYRPDDGRETVEGSGARVMRGGSWFSPCPEALCAYRSRYLAGSRASNIGFRIVQV